MDGRTLLKISTAVRRGLLFADRILRHSVTKTTETAQDYFEPNAWVRMQTDGKVIIRVDRSEMGQGVMTTLAMLVAEELDIELADVIIEVATGRPEYARSVFGVQITSASSSLREGWEPLRYAGAAARARLVIAAAQLWKVHPDSCRTRAGEVFHAESGRRAKYCALAAIAATVRLDRTKVKQAQDFRLIGMSMGRLDSGAVVTGRAVFGTDIHLPGLLTAVVARPPQIGATLVRSDEQSALRCPGVHDVVQIESGIAVVADSFWHACKGREALILQWQESSDASRQDTEAVRQACLHFARKGPTRIVREVGNYRAARRAARRVIAAEYETPYQAHATMEPMNCTAQVTDWGCDVWAPTQNPDGARLVAADITGLPLDVVRVHVPFLGGGFGRRQETDFVIEAVELSHRLRKPVKVMWTREDDMLHDYYHPLTLSRVEGVLDMENHVLGVHYRLVSTSAWQRIAPNYADLIYLRKLPRWARKAGRTVVKKMISLSHDPSIAECANALPYALPSLIVDYVDYDPGVPVGPWRSVGYYSVVFAVESFIDEIAAATQEDPYLLRCKLLRKQPRLLRALQTAARDANWQGKRERGRGLGIACYSILGTFVAMVAEVEVRPETGARISNVRCAVDCGLVVNPDIVRAQIEGGIAFGLSAALKHSITIRNGRVEQSDFDTYPLLRFDEMPAIVVDLLESEAPPSGVGEAATPGVAAAVGNAIYCATRQRLRRLPITFAQLTDI
jgi:CO/xanthine dehydrogenase Mo-binding subunit